MNKKLFLTKEQYDICILNLLKALGAKLPAQEYPKQFPALLVSEIKFHRLHESTQLWVYLSDFDGKNL